MGAKLSKIAVLPYYSFVKAFFPLPVVFMNPNSNHYELETIKTLLLFMKKLYHE